ncbi:DUF1007 family protein [Roseicyclus sp.]|uniref:DUF1007 family protein n=1 Tax=Roseicyclus sp. TaxID=1914329 RepID=UPI001BCC10AC|nr:DUF1007 family protein [Roseicyclus sp.]
MAGRSARRGLCNLPLFSYLSFMVTSRLSLAVLLSFGAALPLAAHPHIFVDAGLRLFHDAKGAVTAVEVTWRYDELYSLLIASDYDLDPDHDMILNPDETAAMLGFDLNWGGGFSGGLVLSQSGDPLALGAPEPVSFSMLPNGQIETTHRRAVQGATPSAPVVAQIFDPEFYIAFEMILDIAADDRAGCTVTLERADLDAAYVVLEAALQEIGGAVAAEDNFPPVGAHFADRAVIACPD